jgi:lipoprotein-anchoring transpeptidase ErfK/SrfK
MGWLRQFAWLTAFAMGAMLIAVAADRVAQLLSSPPGAARVAAKTPAHPSPAKSREMFTVAPGKLPRPRTIAIAPTSPQIAAATEEPADAKAEPARPPQRVMPDPALVGQQAESVAQRLQGKIPAELAPYFDVYLYVSKAADGPWAQRMFVFHKKSDGVLVFEQSFFVSTGRERSEKYFTTTPAGLFELDPNRFERMHYSHRWDGAAMPWAMFFNYTIHFQPAGVALHSAGPHEFELGRRASGGCVRLPEQMAQMLFERFKAEEWGEVPVFTSQDGSTNREGLIARDSKGLPLVTGGYKVLLIIEDYPGEPALVAVIS